MARQQNAFSLHRRHRETEDREVVAWAAGRDSRDEQPRTRGAAVPQLGPYETAYDVSFGYGLERDIVRP